MRVLSGKYKGRVLEGYEINGTRPTMDRVKESLFAMIQDKVKDSIVLDLFSGTGNLGIEALSEGAKEAYLVDQNKICIDKMKKNIEKLQVENAFIEKKDYLAYLKNCQLTFDIIFLDPPYKENYIEKAIVQIQERNLLKKEGIIVCETDKLDKVVFNESLEIVKQKKYGDKYIVILKAM